MKQLKADKIAEASLKYRLRWDQVKVKQLKADKIAEA